LVIELEHFGSLIGANFFTIQQEAETAGLNALALSVRVKHLLHFRRLFDFEKGLFTSLYKSESKR
jgi:hypothetical protein